jgi:putative ABC transport system substrate-binding protein
MQRRDVISLFGAAAASAVSWPLVARAQERMRRLGVIMNYAETDPEGQARLSALRQQLSKLGWTEGSNIQLDVRWAAGKADLMQAYATELVRPPTDLLVANSTPLLTVLKQVTRTLPIVFTQIADPIAGGLVNSYARPDGNMTGFTDFEPSIAGKWIELIKGAAPSLNRLTVLMNPDQTNHPAFLHVIESATASLKLQMSAVAVRNRADIEQSITALSGEADRGLVVLPGPVHNTQRQAIIALAARYRLPAIYPFRYYAKDGGLLYYGTDQVEQWPKAADYVDRILRGEKPSALPVQAPTKFELVINLHTAKALGLEVPPTVLARADEVIE